MHVVPKAIVGSILTLIALAFLLIVTTAANSPGIIPLAGVAFPLNAGYSAAFKMSDRTATVLSLPGIFINLYAVIYAYGRQICALARSRLLPTFLTWTTANNVPYMALIFGSLLGYLIILGLYYNDRENMQTILNYLFSAAQMGSFSVYIISLLSFIIFRQKYSSLQRHFVNKLGIPSAIVGIIIFLFAFIGVAFFQEDQYHSVVYYTVFVGAMTAYYFGYARHVQCFSPEEQSILFAVYIIKSMLILFFIDHFLKMFVPANSRKRTLWSRLGRKFLSLVDQLDSSHQTSEWLSSVFNGRRQHHAHNNRSSIISQGQVAGSGSSPQKSSVRPSNKHAAAANSGGDDVMSIRSTSVGGNLDAADEHKLNNQEDLTVVSASPTAAVTSALGGGISGMTYFLDTLNELDEPAENKVRVKGGGSTSNYKAEESSLRVVPVEDVERFIPDVVVQVDTNS